MTSWCAAMLSRATPRDGTGRSIDSPPSWIEEHTHDRTHDPWCAGLSAADVRARLRLASRVVQAVLRGAGHLSPGHHHPVRLPVDVDPGGALRLDLRAGARAARWLCAIPRSRLRLLRRVAVVELHDARRRGEECHGFGAGLSR